MEKKLISLQFFSARTIKPNDLQSDKAKRNQISRDYCNSRIWKSHIQCNVEKMKIAPREFRSNRVSQSHVTKIRKSFIEAGVACELGNPMLGVVFLSKLNFFHFLLFVSFSNFLCLLWLIFNAIDPRCSVANLNLPLVYELGLYIFAG